MEHLPSALQKSCKSSSAPHPVVFSPASAMQELCDSGGVCVLNYGERKREVFSVSKTEKFCLFFPKEKNCFFLFDEAVVIYHSSS